MRVTALFPLGIIAALALLVVACGGGTEPETQADLTITLDAGTVLEVAPLENLSPVTQEAGDEFTAMLSAPLMKDAQIIAPQGTTVVGEVVDAKAAGPGDEGSFLTLELRKILVSDGEPIEISTEPVQYAPGAAEEVEGIPDPAVVPEDTVVQFRLSEPVEVPIAAATAAGREPIS
jgi:hypothetical protein